MKKKGQVSPWEFSSFVNSSPERFCLSSFWGLTLFHRRQRMREKGKRHWWSNKYWKQCIPCMKHLDHHISPPLFFLNALSFYQRYLGQLLRAAEYFYPAIAIKIQPPWLVAWCAIISAPCGLAGETDRSARQTRLENTSTSGQLLSPALPVRSVDVPDLSLRDFPSAQMLT